MKIHSALYDMIKVFQDNNAIGKEKFMHNCIENNRVHGVSYWVKIIEQAWLMHDKKKKRGGVGLLEDLVLLSLFLLCMSRIRFN